MNHTIYRHIDLQAVEGCNYDCAFAEAVAIANEKNCTVALVYNKCIFRVTPSAIYRRVRMDSKPPGIKEK